MVGIDFSAMFSWIATSMSPVFGTSFSIGIALEIFIAYACLRSGAGIVMTAGALFVTTFILASMSLLPAIAYVFMVLIAAITLAYLVFLKPSQGK